MLALALIAAALAVGHADRNPVAVHAGIAFQRHDVVPDTFVDWRGRVRRYDPYEFWSPSGRHVARPHTECANGSCESWWVVTRADGSHRHVLPDARTAPTWSKDDSTLAYVGSAAALEVADGDGSNAHAVRVDTTCGFDCALHFDEPKMSPDGRAIALLITTLEARPARPQKDVPADLYVVPVTGGAAVAVGREVCPPDSHVEWSPDSTWLAYVTNPCDELYGGRLEVASADGLHHGLSARTNEYAWSPRRPLLAYRLRGRLVVATPRRALRTLEHVRGWAWSPDGRRLVLERQGRIEILDDGTTHAIARGASPTWTPHGIAWSVPRCGPMQGIWLAGRRLTNRCTVDGPRGTPWPDEVWAVNDRAERVTCGAGYDIVHADPADIVARDCERVVRRR